MITLIQCDKNTNKLEIQFHNFRMKRIRTFSDDELSDYIKCRTERALSVLKISLETSISQRNKVVENFKVENEYLRSEVSRVKSSLESIRVEHEEYKASMVDKIEHFKQIYDEKFQRLQNERESLIQKMRNKVSDDTDEVILLDIPKPQSQEARTIKRLKEKLSKRKEKLNMTLKRTRELSDLNIEKDKIIQVKSKNIEDLVLINERFEQSKGDLLLKIDDLELNSVKIEMLQTKINDQDLSLQNVSRRNKALTSENEALAARLSYIESEQETITESQEKMIEDANVEINSLKSVESSLKDKLETKCDEVVDAIEELKKVTDELETKTLEVDSFKDKLQNIETKNTELIDQQAALQKNYQYIIRENEDLKGDLRKQVEQNISTQTLIVQLKETLKRQEIEVKNLKQPSTSDKQATKTKQKYKGVERTLSKNSNKNDNPLTSLYCNVSHVNIPHGIALETIID